MTETPPVPPNALAAYTVVMLEHAGRYLLLRRGESRPFAPGRWTGIGGRVEPEELSDLQASALRELAEESAITPEQIDRFALRRALLLARPGGGLTLLLYYTGALAAPLQPSCPEGTLTWVTADQLPELDVIESTRPVLPLLIADQTRDPLGLEPIHLGLAGYHPDGTLARVVWL